MKPPVLAVKTVVTELVAAPPEPLLQPTQESNVFPMQALGGDLCKAAMAIKAKCGGIPDALAAQSVLACAALVAQAHVDVKLPHGAISPCSLYFLPIAESGERKSACDRLAMQPVQDYEEELWQDYRLERQRWQNEHDTWEVARKKILGSKGKQSGSKEAIKAQLEALGAAPIPPREPIILCPEPTLEALTRTWDTGWPSLGLFSDEGGQFLGGFSMRDEHRLRTIAGLSKAWDGSPQKRMRVHDGNYSLYGKRLSIHLMVQPVLADELLANRLFVSQGFLNRFLVCKPPSTMGSRFYRPVADATIESDYRKYYDKIYSLLQRPLPLKEGTHNSLQPRVLPMSPEAQALWIEFHNRIETDLAPDGLLRPIAGYASKAAEQVARLACVCTYFDGPDAAEISGEAMANAIQLVQYYLGEACRLFLLEPPDPVLEKAEVLRQWLNSRWEESFISVPDISQYGPNQLRNNKPVIESVCKLLAAEGHLVAVDEPETIKGKNRKQAWQVIRVEVSS